MKKKPAVGTRVRLTGEFLHNTGQITGPEGLARWTVMPCDCSLCALGNHVAVDEPYVYDPDSPRHIHIGVLERAR
ncbi:MAG TPA: hypothetical protein VJS69_01255 [Candidatus Krumholzibacteria bacterium]|nr:hypothetical protein [Candidatus Krumholzibacteria bacterium]